MESYMKKYQNTIITKSKCLIITFAPLRHFSQEK